MLLSGSLTAATPNANESAIRTFLSKPPIISNFVFQINRNLGFPTKNSQQFRTRKYLARVQHDEVYLQGIADFADVQREPDEGWPERVVLASTGMGSWTLRDSALYVMEGTSLPEFWGREKTSLFRERAAFFDLQSALNLGIKEVPIATIK